MNLPDPEWIVRGLIPKDGRVCIYAPPNSGKTVMLAGLAVSIATGRDWFGHPIEHRGGVIYVPSEDVSGFRSRLESANQPPMAVRTKWRARGDVSKVAPLRLTFTGLAA